MTKVVLASSNPWSLGKYGKHGNYESLGIRYLASFLINQGYDVEMIDDISDKIEEKLLTTEADVYGISLFTYQWPFYKQLLSKLKRYRPSAKIILGGYHPSSAIPEVARHSCVDAVVYGEGEATLGELLPKIIEGDSLKSVEGIAYSCSGNVIINPPRARISDIDALPWPLRDKEGVDHSKTYGLSYPSHEDQISSTMLYSRGCPHACDFCSSPNIWQRKINWRDPKDVADEIRSLQYNYGVNHLYFADLFFNLNSDKTRELCSAISDIDISWFPMTGITSDLGIYKTMAEAGCSKIGIGAESLDAETRKRIGKAKWANFENNLQAAWDAGLIVRLYLMGGYPWDTRETLESFSQNLKNLPVDDFKISFYTPFPGTSSYEKYKHLLITDDLSKFNTVFDPVLKPEALTIEELEQWRGQVFKDFFYSPEYEARMNKKIKKLPHLKRSYDSFFKSLRERRVI